MVKRVAKFLWVVCLFTPVSLLQATTFLPEIPIEKNIFSDAPKKDGLLVSIGSEYASTIRSSALAAFWGPFGQDSFMISHDRENALLSDNYYALAKESRARTKISLSLQAQRYALEPFFKYSKDDWFLGIKVPWRVVEHKTKYVFTPGDEKLASAAMTKVLEDYFKGNFEDTNRDHLQAKLLYGKLTSQAQRVAGLSDIFFVVGRNNQNGQKDLFRWGNVGVFARLPVAPSVSQEMLCQPQLGLGGSCEVGLMGNILFPRTQVGQVDYAQALQGKVSFHFPYSKVLLPKLQSKGWGHAVLVGVERMSQSMPLLPLANVLTKHQNIESRMDSRFGYEGVFNYNQVLVNITYALRYEEGERVSSVGGLSSVSRFGLGDLDFYDGTYRAHSFGDDGHDFESDLNNDWLSSKDFSTKPLRSSLVGQEVGVAFSKKIGFFEWKAAFLYLNYPHNVAFDSFSMIFAISHFF
ncbi:hypothetical protein FJ364_02670 [Candidatus Dependentiae bacterium]|nr:hypothetical protein [Candidatus Dependentiae bacterium]